MQILVKSLFAKALAIDAEPSDTIEKVKKISRNRRFGARSTNIYLLWKTIRR